MWSIASGYINFKAVRLRVSLETLKERQNKWEKCPLEQGPLGEVLSGHHLLQKRRRLRGVPKSQRDMLSPYKPSYNAWPGGSKLSCNRTACWYVGFLALRGKKNHVLIQGRRSLLAFGDKESLSTIPITKTLFMRWMMTMMTKRRLKRTKTVGCCITVAVTWGKGPKFCSLTLF